MSKLYRYLLQGTENSSNRRQQSPKDEKIPPLFHRSTALVGIALITLLFLGGCGRSPENQPSTSSADEWHEFQGTWTSTGNRNVIRFGDDRRAAIATFTGSLLLSGPSRPAVGFRAEAIAFNDTATGMVGRAVWTDEHGDKAFSELRGEGTATNNKIEGTFVGGTGRYAGITGTYEFSWRYQIENEDGSVQGESIGLHGRVRVDSSRVTLSQGEPQS